ncbi:hypothetical protein CRV00_13035 [Malaciobacter molluscorum]|uniref:hypothetical protein n=1 Tax=Malaciobacter molluscorum TaxID=1032072 RepID=UPI00100BF461|nr:hypothetical protein [Malaciobacter molluscorum]RXJ92337.1 hypothetical protein CRV00_13035 [Malaciobacter molluscorum]
MQTLFNNYSSIIVFLHVISAVLWVGGMIAIRFAIHYSIQDIQEPKIKLERTLENLRRFFNMVIPTILIILLTAIIMIISLNLKQSSLHSIAIAKESIWTIMTIVFITIYIKRNKAQKYFENNDFDNCKKQLAPIAKYFIPLNILLGVIAIYLGVTLRGF